MNMKEIVQALIVVVALTLAAIGFVVGITALANKSAPAEDIVVSTEDGTINLGRSVKSEKLLYSMCIKVEDRKPACEFTTKDRVLSEVKQVMRPGEATARDIKIAVNAAVTYTGENGQEATSLITPKGKYLPAGTPSEVHIQAIANLFDSVYNDYKQNFSKM
ncbi:hypothetical protein 20Sep418_00144 [Pseudomonas phage 20Sep418]|nr:hypothetical protein AU075_gp086 [Pseudomonas phage C11]YP_009598185.1 hypothetical protein FDH21_gp085 [Pseudomonas phage Zigelbrucke]YP_009623543.1 hypothetical protein FDJ38_gp090 [Pseudomonas phage vB_PaeM_C2-10_Ab02]YP_010762214.1 hypothetical protein QE323_gp088 [Pseudomonas phage SPA05]YP_010762807.1 hypothetical protein QE326_gp132 [Pseudomonas phage PaZq-1]YP_010763127.1 hypothetical protein QE328_gp085 [Pseudomonas phage vB_PaM_EPA1]YP_010763464.1 hypothetical protein QE330_gp086